MRHDLNLADSPDADIHQDEPQNSPGKLLSTQPRESSGSRRSITFTWHNFTHPYKASYGIGFLHVAVGNSLLPSADWSAGCLPAFLQFHLDTRDMLRGWCDVSLATDSGQSRV